MKRYLIAAIIGLSTPSLISHAEAATCARGVYRAGCVGPNGAAVVRRPYVPPRPTGVACGAGVYRAGCVGPHGAVVRRRY
jgi:hypothetical protein